MSVLGTCWCKEDDILSFNSFQLPTYLLEVEENEETIEDIVKKTEQEIDNILFTKRMLASISAKSFDVSGFITPYVFLSKKLLQQTWIQKCNWDSVLLENLLLSVQRLRKGATLFERCQGIKKNNTKKWKINRIVCFFRCLCSKLWNHCSVCYFWRSTRK